MSHTSSEAIARHGYTVIKKVGEGSYGAAILVQHSGDKDRGTQAIIKTIDISRTTREESTDALKESQVLSTLKHPYIVKHRESFFEFGWLCIVMDYCEGGDLSERIKKMRASERTFPEDQVARWFTQAILALKYIHDKHILHRDLKSGNFFLSKAGNIKLGDFGISKVLECTAAVAQTQIGTPYYLSPEICQGKPYSWDSDIWAMGCILYEMCATHVPFNAPDLRTLIQRITKDPPPNLPAEYSEPLRALYGELLNRDPSKRPQATEILRRPVVQDMVKRMLDEVKKDDVKKEEGASTPAQPLSAEGREGKYVKGEIVEYYSQTHGEWLPAQVVDVDDQGRVQLNVKPNVWLPLDHQRARVRPRAASGAAAAAAGAASSSTPREAKDA